VATGLAAAGGAGLLAAAGGAGLLAAAGGAGLLAAAGGGEAGFAVVFVPGIAPVAGGSGRFRLPSLSVPFVLPAIASTPPLSGDRAAARCDRDRARALRRQGPVPPLPRWRWRRVAEPGLGQRRGRRIQAIRGGSGALRGHRDDALGNSFS
jgi:hypothetical protein